MYSFLFLEHIREFFEHDGILGSQSQFITQRIRDAAPFLNAHVLSALRMGECTARDLCTVRQGLLSDVTRTAERAKLDRTRSTFVIGSSMRGLRMIIRIIHHIKSECALRYAFYDLSGMTSALNFTRMAVPARTRARIGGIEAAC